MKYDNILQTIGNTPHVRINHLFRNDIEVWMKIERFNPGSSIKDRIALSMIEDAEANRRITLGSRTFSLSHTGIAMLKLRSPLGA